MAAPAADADGSGAVAFGPPAPRGKAEEEPGLGRPAEREAKASVGDDGAAAEAEVGGRGGDAGRPPNGLEDPDGPADS